MSPWPFALQTAPFPAVVDPRRYYPSSTHENALRGLVSAWQEGEPWISLSGAPGTGKTLLLHLLMEMIPQGSRLAYITQPLRDPLDLVRIVAHDWHLDDGSARPGVARNRVIEAILEGLRQGTPPVVLVEQADLMSEQSADELMSWSHLQGKGQAGIQVLLCARGELPGLTALGGVHDVWSMVGGGGSLAPLEAVEASDFLRFQIRWAGGTPSRILGVEAEELMIDLGAGNPRRLCQLGRHASRLASAAGMDSIELEAVEQAACELWGGRDSRMAGIDETDSPSGFGESEIPDHPDPRMDIEDSKTPIEEEIPKLPLRRSA